MIERKALKVVGVALVIAAMFPVQAIDGGRVFKSAVFPGMGQLADDQVPKGLLFMSAEVVCLSVMFGQWSQANSYSHETRVLQILYDRGGDYAAVAKNHADWQSAYDKSGTSRQLMLVAAGAAGLCWLLNLGDAILLGPRDTEDDEVSILKAIEKHTLVSFDTDRTEIAFTLSF